jgi:hypothetical protein
MQCNMLILKDLVCWLIRGELLASHWSGHSGSRASEKNPRISRTDAQNEQMKKVNSFSILPSFSDSTPYVWRRGKDTTASIEFLHNFPIRHQDKCSAKITSCFEIFSQSVRGRNSSLVWPKRISEDKSLPFLCASLIHSSFRGNKAAWNNWPESIVKNLTHVWELHKIMPDLRCLRGFDDEHFESCLHFNSNAVV